MGQPGVSADVGRLGEDSIGVSLDIPVATSQCRYRVCTDYSDHIE